MTGRERILTLLAGGTPDRPGLMPITMMFASSYAGQKHGRYALDHRLLVEAQLRTAEAFGFDHVSAISESREAPDCGAAIRIFDDQPFALDEERSLLADKTVFAGLKPPDPYTAQHMQDRLQAIASLRREVGDSLIVEGWVEGPCGASADLRGINRLMTDFYDDPAFVNDLLEFVLDLGLRFGKAQIEAGADVIGIGDPAASLIGPRLYEEFIFPFEKRLADGLRAAGGHVRLHICGNTRRMLRTLARLGCGIVDVDSMVEMPEAREELGPEPALLGGIDPVRVLERGSPEEVAAAVAQCHRDAGPRYILGGGCEITRGTPRENMLALTQYARNHGSGAAF